MAGELRRRSSQASLDQAKDMIVAPQPGEERQRALVVCNGECNGNHNSVFARTYRENCHDLQVTPNTGVFRLLDPCGICVLRLRAVSFKNFFLGDRGCDAIFEGLFTSIPHVELVNLSGTGMRGSGAESMTRLFTSQEMPRLQSVDLSENPIPDNSFLPLLQWLVQNKSMFDLGLRGTLLSRDHQLTLMFQAIHNRSSKLGISGLKVAKDKLAELYKLYPEAGLQNAADHEFPGDLSKWLSGEAVGSHVVKKVDKNDEIAARMTFVSQLWQQSRERLRRLDGSGALSSASPRNPNHNRKQIVESVAKTPSNRPMAKTPSNRDQRFHTTPGGPILDDSFQRGNTFGKSKSQLGSSQRSRSEGAKEPRVDGLPIWAREMAREYPKLETRHKELQKRNNELELVVAQQQEEVDGMKNVQAQLEQKVAEQQEELNKLRIREVMLSKLLEENQTKQSKPDNETEQDPKTQREEQHRKSAFGYADDLMTKLTASFASEDTQAKSATASAAIREAWAADPEPAELPVMEREGSHVHMVKQLRENAEKAATADDKEAAAALKIQSIQRGKQARKEVQEKKAQQTQN